ncbi:peroxiredoxin [Phenylobacterium soli]|uniref:thioredoxin-dependent peroxiredoxin n=1 Tax=Phenylobacterium soli TaxID=2170551 RepID=A0A328ANL7_9CAUL|nr:peroxiredoxin [Phenylobacterium soli]RAK55476.1 peroxiredoxin [Phenylobacterium soli]
MSVTEGAAAPEFEMETLEGPVKLADFVGKTLVLYFYPKDDTTGCTNEAKAFTELSGEFAKAGAVVLGVSKDSLAAHRKFTDKYGLKVRLGSDPEGATIERYGSWVEKSLYGRRYMGIDRSTFVIRDGVVRKLWRKVKVAGHAEAVLAAVKAL